MAAKPVLWQMLDSKRRQKTRVRIWGSAVETRNLCNSTDHMCIRVQYIWLCIALDLLTAFVGVVVW